MDWQLIHGDPAPGSPEAVSSAESILRRVADMAGDATNNLVKQTGAAGVERWKGTAAETFRDDVHKLPGLLNNVTTSYREAAGALGTYRSRLEQAQAEARAALAAAQQAQADHDAAHGRLLAAQAELEALNSQLRSAEIRQARLQAQQALSPDPAHKASLNAPIASARAQVNRLRGDINAAKAAVNRYRQAMDEAEARLKAQQQRADGIRNTMAQAVGVAVIALKQAERDAHLPSWLERHYTDAKQDLLTYGPVLVKTLNDAQFVLSLASVIPTPLSPILRGAALVCGAGAFLLSLGIDAAQPGGLTTAEVLDLGSQALSLVSGAAAAKGLATAARVAGYGSDAFAIADNAVEHGGSPEAIVYAMGSYVVGKGATGGVLRAVDKAVANPAVSSRLNRMTDSLNKDVGVSGSGTSLHLTLDSPPRSSVVVGPTPHPSEGPTRDFVEQLIDKGKDSSRDWAENQVPALNSPEPEIDINLDPSPYGNER